MDYMRTSVIRPLSVIINETKYMKHVGKLYFKNANVCLS